MALETLLGKSSSASRLAYLSTISVRGGLSLWHRIALAAVLLGVLVAAFFDAMDTAALMVTIFIFIFGMIVAVKLFVSLGSGGVKHVPEPLLPDAECPSYTVLVALHKEAAVLPYLIQSLSAMDYPRDRLQVLLLLEEDDLETRQAAASLLLPQGFEVVVVPQEEPGPRCKPRALEFARKRGLKGELMVIYDAEDRPEPDQMRKAATVFAHSGQELVCLQAELRWYNAEQSLMTRMAAGAYASTFALLLPGLSRTNAIVPLGGTSCHIRTSALSPVGGWDPYNVTEDLDLGIKFRRAGLRVAMLPSVTWEEAPTTARATIKQHSRWIKGHTATFIAHTRNPFKLFRDLGLFGSLTFLLIIGGAHVAILAAPVFWSMTIAYVFTGARVIEEVTPSPAFYIGFICLLGNFVFAWHAMFACIVTRQYKMVPWMILLPVFWVTVLSVAGLKAAWEIMSGRLYYWDKTAHGFALESSETAKEVIAGGAK